jgi:hypothetical protein
MVLEMGQGQGQKQGHNRQLSWGSSEQSSTGLQIFFSTRILLSHKKCE